MPSTNEVPDTGIDLTRGSPSAGVKPAGCFWMPAKIVARMTEMNVNRAENVPSFDSVEKVRGVLKKKQMMADSAAKATVQRPWSLVIVLRYLAEVRTWRP